MDKNSGSSGLGIFSVLTIIFVVLKLVGVITWSWWWVLSPIWIGFALTIIVIVIYVVYLVHEDKKDYSRRKKDKWKF